VTTAVESAPKPQTRLIVFEATVTAPSRQPGLQLIVGGRRCQMLLARGSRYFSQRLHGSAMVTGGGEVEVIARPKRATGSLRVAVTEVA